MIEYFILNANLIPVYGKKRCAIYDLRANKVSAIPHILFDLIKALEKEPVEVLLSKYNQEVQGYMRRYLADMLDKGWGVNTEYPERFPLLNLDWHSPSVIESAVLDYNFYGYSFSRVASQLDDLLCKYLEIRIPLPVVNNEDVFSILKFIENTTVRSVTLVLPFLSSDKSDLQDVFLKYKKLKTIIYFCADRETKTKISSNEEVIYTLKTFIELIAPSKIKHVVNTLYFTEALKYNPYYNKKLCIDHNGNVKNCLKLSADFGNVKQDLIQDIVRSERFQNLWNINCDRIIGVKDSAFRYSIFLTEELICIGENIYDIRYKDNCIIPE